MSPAIVTFDPNQGAVKGETMSVNEAGNASVIVDMQRRCECGCEVVWRNGCEGVVCIVETVVFVGLQAFDGLPDASQHC